MHVIRAIGVVILVALVLGVAAGIGAVAAAISGVVSWIFTGLLIMFIIYVGIKANQSNKLRDKQ